MADTLRVVILTKRSGTPRLRCTGLVEHPRRWEWRELLDLPQSIPDLGAVAEGFVGRAVPIRALFEEARPLPEGRFVTVESDDGHYRASIPLSELAEKGWLAFSLEGSPLPRDQGGPLRVVVPQGRTLCWNVKGAVELRVTSRREPDSVPAKPTH